MHFSKTEQLTFLLKQGYSPQQVKKFMNSATAESKGLVEQAIENELVQGSGGPMGGTNIATLREHLGRPKLGDTTGELNVGIKEKSSPLAPDNLKSPQAEPDLKDQQADDAYNKQQNVNEEMDERRQEQQQRQSPTTPTPKSPVSTTPKPD